MKCIVLVILTLFIRSDFLFSKLSTEYQLDKIDFNL
jgi:hypothetical protein